jgi:integrase
VWTPEQLRAFLEETADHRLGTCFRVAALTGLRRGELLALKWSDINSDEGRLTVRRSLVDVDGEARFGEPKTRRSRRSVDVGAGLVAALRAHRARQLEERLALGLGRGGDDGLVFCEPDGRPLRPRRVSVEFRRAVDATDLPRISLHGLRHTHASHLVASGTHVQAIVERLGHCSASFSLDKYAHALPTLGAEAATRIEALVDGQRP